MYDAFVRGALIEDIVRAAKINEPKITAAKVVAEIEAMRARLRKRYPGTTDTEADELRAIYLLAGDARKMTDASSLRIAADLQLRHRDIVATAAAREQSRHAREQEQYQ